MADRANDRTGDRAYDVRPTCVPRLRSTADGDFETLCIGEQEEAQEIVARLRLQDADELLLRFSEEFR